MASPSDQLWLSCWRMEDLVGGFCCLVWGCLWPAHTQPPSNLGGSQSQRLSTLNILRNSLTKETSVFQIYRCSPPSFHSQWHLLHSGCSVPRNTLWKMMIATSECFWYCDSVDDKYFYLLYLVKMNYTIKFLANLSWHDSVQCTGLEELGYCTTSHDFELSLWPQSLTFLSKGLVLDSQDRSVD